MTDDALDQKEAAWNVRTEKWMQHTAGLFRMNWIVLPDNVCIERKHIRRYFLGILVRVPILLLLLMAVAMTALFVAAFLFHRGTSILAFPDYVLLKSVAGVVSEAFIRFGPFLILYCLLLPAVAAAYFSKRAHYWNRRAQRLQANPELSTVIANPGVWPPPPRI